MAPTIVWDVDDVLNSLMRDWFEQAWLPAHPECAVQYEDLGENPPHRILGVEREEYLASADAFRASEAARRMQPNTLVLEWMREHGAGFRHVALTARPLETTPHVAEWMFRHFGTWIRCFGVVPSRAEPGLPEYHRNKGEWLAWLGGADLLVDDSLENVRLAEALGIRAMVWPQPWNGGGTVNEALRKIGAQAGRPAPLGKR